MTDNFAIFFLFTVLVLSIVFITSFIIIFKTTIDVLFSLYLSNGEFKNKDADSSCSDTLPSFCHNSYQDFDEDFDEDLSDFVKSETPNHITERHNFLEKRATSLKESLLCKSSKPTDVDNKSNDEIEEYFANSFINKNNVADELHPMVHNIPHSTISTVAGSADREEFSV